MPAKSKAQQKAATIALLAKKGKISKNKLYGASKEMLKMKTKDLKKFASTKTKNLPKKINEEITKDEIKQLKKYALEKILYLQTLLSSIYYELKAKELSLTYEKKIINNDQSVILKFAFKILNNIKSNVKLYSLLKPILENKTIYISFSQFDYLELIFKGVKDSSLKFKQPKNLNEAKYFIEKFYIEQELFLKSILKTLSSINIIIKT